MKIIQAILLSAALNAFAADQAPDAAAGGAKTDPTAVYRKMDNPGAPSSLDLVFGKKDGASYAARMKAVQAIPDNLSEPEIQSLIFFLHRRIADDNLQPMELNAIKNDIVCRLMNQKTKPAGLNLHLVSMYNDPESDYMWRDYCIQFLAPGCMNANSEEEKKLLIDTLWDATKESDKGIAGTSLLSLSKLADKGIVGKDKVSEKAYDLLTGKKTSNATKITAMQVCANFRHPKALKTAKELLSTEKDVSLKMSSIAAIGALGGKDDMTLLKPFVESPDNRLRTAAAAASKKLQK